MSRTIRIGRRLHAAPAPQRTSRSHGRSRTCSRTVLAAGITVLVLTVVVGCTAQPVAQSGTARAPTATATTTTGLPLLKDQPTNAPLAPGGYVVSVSDAPSSAPVAPVLEVPAGYVTDGGMGVWADNGEEDGNSGVWVWDIRSVYTHPCDASGYPEAVGPSVTDLASALAAQPMREGTRPVPVTIGGHDGLYVELFTPDDLDFATCREGYFHSWPGRSDRAPGSMDLLWIVEVEGQRFTFDLTYPASATPDQVEELKEIVTTATFTRPEGT